MITMRPENHDTPPASPQLSDTMSLPACGSDLSDVSLLSDDEDKHTSDFSDSDCGGPDDDEDFTNISRSMAESTFIDVAGDLASMSGDEASPVTAESPDVDPSKEIKGIRHRSRDRTPSASISLSRSSAPKAATHIPTAYELRYPDPISDGASPFRSQASLDDSVASDRTIAATASSQPDEGSRLSFSDWRLAGSDATGTDKASLVTSISSTDSAVLIGASQKKSKLSDSMDPFVSSSTSSLSQEAKPPARHMPAPPASRRAYLRHPGVLALSVATIAIALGIYKGQGGQISIFPTKDGSISLRTDVMIHSNNSTRDSKSLMTEPPAVDASATTTQAVTAAIVAVTPASTTSATMEVALMTHQEASSASTDMLTSALPDQAISALITMTDDSVHSASLPRRRKTAGEDCRKAATVPVAEPSYAHAISALSLYNDRIRSLSLSRYVPKYALEALKPSIFNKTKHTKQKRRARQIRRRLARRARQSYSVLKGDIPEINGSVRTRRSRKQCKEEGPASDVPKPETVQGDSIRQVITPEAVCTCKCSQDTVEAGTSPLSEGDADELFLSPIRTPKRVLESMNYLTFVKWIEEVVNMHLSLMVSYLSVDSATSRQLKHLKKELRRSVDPMLSIPHRYRTISGYTKQAIHRELYAWKNQAKSTAKRIKQGSRKSASRARRNARTVVKRMYRK